MRGSRTVRLDRAATSPQPVAAPSPAVERPSIARPRTKRRREYPITIGRASLLPLRVDLPNRVLGRFDRAVEVAALGVLREHLRDQEELPDFVEPPGVTGPG